MSEMKETQTIHKVIEYLNSHHTQVSALAESRTVAGHRYRTLRTRLFKSITNLLEREMGTVEVTLGCLYLLPDSSRRAVLSHEIDDASLTI